MTAPTPTPRILPPEARPALLPYRDRSLYRGRCVRCGGPLPKRKRNWCGNACMAEYYREVGWTARARLVEWGTEHPCASCGATVKAEEIEVDHHIPLALGGTSDPSNLQKLCRPCHRAKTRQDARDIAAARRPNGPTAREMARKDGSIRKTPRLDAYTDGGSP